VTTSSLPSRSAASAAGGSELVFERSTGHEQVVFCQDPASGLRAIIALYSTALGPGLGGTRFYPYASEADALADVLALSEGMAYKNALAGLDHGGGKAVIIGDPATDKTEPLLRAYGRFVQSLGGRYITACDVGTYTRDMDVVARECDFVTGRSESDGGAGDSSVLTAFGVYQGMRAAAQHLWGDPGLSGRRIGVAGVGKVGRHLVGHAVSEGAQVVVTDVSAVAVESIRARHPEVDVVEDADAMVSCDLDVYAPCALGGALDDAVAARLRASAVCGAANNQLAHAGVAKALADRGVLYCPDYLVNSGGVIQVADELAGFSFERAKAKVEHIFTATLAVLAAAERDGTTPAAAADCLAEQRIAEVGSLRRIWTPR
jgi:valine dehydrogenase (NAD+)